ncbi:MAG: hypothetical protein MAG794_00608 [Gammaproteobacteria bacterium]|nr:hypothetical protein [Gammaproteobacteria bacterium]
MVLNTLQRVIQHVYEIDLQQHVADFTTSDRAFARQYGSAHGPMEQLIFREDGNDVDVSLYLDNRVVDALQGIEDGHSSINMICLAVEGVSHFVHFCWRSQYKFDMSLLELEIQAEVDKYVLLTDLYGDHDMHRRLFERYLCQRGMSGQLTERYKSANRFAAKYCRKLEKEFIQPGKTKEMLNELRRFCRKDQRQKISAIEQAI